MLRRRDATARGKEASWSPFEGNNKAAQAVERSLFKSDGDSIAFQCDFGPKHAEELRENTALLQQVTS